MSDKEVDFKYAFRILLVPKQDFQESIKRKHCFHWFTCAPVLEYKNLGRWCGKSAKFSHNYLPCNFTFRVFTMGNQRLLAGEVIWEFLWSLILLPASLVATQCQSQGRTGEKECTWEGKLITKLIKFIFY